MPSANRQPQSALRVPVIGDFSASTQAVVAFTWRSGRVALAGLVWVLLVMAAARPYWIAKNDSSQLISRNLMLAVDVSGSMGERDFSVGDLTTNRITAAKAVVGRFVERRKGDRMGLIVFGTYAYLYVPMTFDRRTLKSMLDETFIGIAGTNTAIGDAIGIAIKTLQKQKSGDRVLVLMTDGKQTDGRLDPIAMARIAKKANMKIYTIGIGPSDSYRMRRYPFFMGGAGNALDEVTLRRIAAITGGQYFRATDTHRLNQIYKYLDEVEPAETTDDQLKPKHELYHWFLGTAALLIFFYVMYQAYRVRQPHE